MKLYILFLYIIMVLIWGTSWIGIKLQLGIVPPELSVVYRFMIASIILWAFCLVAKKQLRFSTRNHVFFALQGFFQFCLNYQFFYIASESLTSGVVSLALSTITVMNIINAAIFFRQPISAKGLVAALVGLLGLALVFWPEVNNAQNSSRTWIGLVFALSGTLCASLGTMTAVRHNKAKIPIISSTLFAMTYGALFSGIFACFHGTPLIMDWSGRYVASMLYLAIPATILAFGIYFFLIKNIGADKASYATLFFPIVALIISTIFENYHWSLLAIMGVVLVLGGNVMILYKPQRSRSKI